MKEYMIREFTGDPDKLFALLERSGMSKDVVIDCKELEYIASSGLRILLGILKGAKTSGSKVVMRGVNDDIKNVFQLTGFIHLFDFE